MRLVKAARTKWSDPNVRTDRLDAGLEWEQRTTELKDGWAGLRPDLQFPFVPKEPEA